MLFNVYKLELSCEQGVQSSYCLLNEPGEQVAFLFVFDFKNILFLKRMEGKCFNCNCATLEYFVVQGCFKSQRNNSNDYVNKSSVKL